MCKRVATIFLVVMAFGAVANAQTTQPAQGWEDSVRRVAEAVRGKDLNALRHVLADGPVIRTFTSETLHPPERLLGATTGAAVLSLNAYLKLPSTLATDLSDDFKAADVPETVRRDFVIPDVTMERDLNEIAARWVAQALQPGSDTPVAVIVLWRHDRSDSFQNTAGKRPVFMLIKGEQVEDNYVIRQITYGDPLERPR